MPQTFPISVSEIMKQSDAVEVDAMLPWTFRYMRARSLNSIPVLTRVGNLIGVVSESDILKTIVSLIGTDHYDELTHITAGDVMTTPALTISELAPISDAIEVMLTNGVSSLPVLGGVTFVGIIYKSHLVNALMAEPLTDVLWKNKTSGF